MTAELLGEGAPDVEDFLACWIGPLMRCATERKADEELPFCQVARLAGADDPDAGTDDAAVQLDIFDRGAAAASVAADRVHRRMMLLARTMPDVTMSDGSTANADFVTTTIKPFRMSYEDDQIVRYVARYQLGLSYVAV